MQVVHEREQVGEDDVVERLAEIELLPARLVEAELRVRARARARPSPALTSTPTPTLGFSAASRSPEPQPISSTRASSGTWKRITWAIRRWYVLFRRFQRDSSLANRSKNAASSA